MVATRSMRKRSASKNRTYARRVRKSHCRSKGRATCRRASCCKYARGKKRSFCRKSKNTRCMMGGKKRRGKKGRSSKKSRRSRKSRRGKRRMRGGQSTTGSPEGVSMMKSHYTPTTL